MRCSASIGLSEGTIVRDDVTGISLRDQNPVVVISVAYLSNLGIVGSKQVRERVEGKRARVGTVLQNGSKISNNVIPGMIVWERSRWGSNGKSGKGAVGGEQGFTGGREKSPIGRRELAKFLANGAVRSGSKVSASGTGAGDLPVSDAVRGGSLAGRPIILMGFEPAVVPGRPATHPVEL